MRIDAQLPENLWPEAIKTAAYVTNRSPSKGLEWKTPLETSQQALGILNPKLNIAHLKAYGCHVYITIPKKKIPRLQKVAPRAHIGYLVGYDSTNIFRIWRPDKQKVISAHSVMFNEKERYCPDEPSQDDQLSQEIDQLVESIKVPSLPTFEPATNQDTDEEDTDHSSPGTFMTPNTSSKSTSRGEDIAPGLPTPEQTPEPQTPQTVTQTTPSSTSSDSGLSQTERHSSTTISADVSESNIIKGSRSHKKSVKARAEAYFEDLEHLDDLSGYHSAFAAGIMSPKRGQHRDQLPGPPRLWKELRTHPKRQGFEVAACKEYQDLERRNTWRQVPKISATRTLPLMWVFTYKFDTNGYLIKYKARICVRGDLQPPDHRDNYAATLAAWTFRALMGITAAFDLEAYQLDAVSAFTNSKLDEIIYCEFPEGFARIGYCLLLLCGLYGLRRSPLLWLRDFTGTLTSLGL
jgi:hypothetical protein